MNILQQALLNAHKLHELTKIWSPKKTWRAKGCNNPFGISVSNSHLGNKALSQSFLAHGGNLSTVLSSLKETRTIFTPNDVKSPEKLKTERPSSSASPLVNKKNAE